MKTNTQKGPVQLSENQLNELMRRYYAGENVFKLIDEFHLSVAANQIATLFPAEILNDTNCVHCNATMIRQRPSRSAQHSGRQLPPPLCPECGHEDQSSCLCTQCLSPRRMDVVARERDLGARIEAPFSQRSLDVVTFESMSLAEAVILTALARVGLDENGVQISPLYLHAVPLAPRWSDSIAYVTCLYERGLIDIDPTTQATDCVSVEHGYLAVNPAAVKWHLTLGTGAAEGRRLLHDLEATLEDSQKWPKAWFAETLDLWQQLAISESLSYLESKLADYGFDFSPSDKTVEMFAALLEHFSIAQIYNFIWSSAKDAAAFYLRGGVSRQIAVSTVVGTCQRRAERALVEKWQIKGFRRDYRHAESISAAVFAYVVTGLSDEYFTTPPSESRIAY